MGYEPFGVAGVVVGGGDGGNGGLMTGLWSDSVGRQNRIRQPKLM